MFANHEVVEWTEGECVLEPGYELAHCHIGALLNTFRDQGGPDLSFVQFTVAQLTAWARSHL